MAIITLNETGKYSIFFLLEGFIYIYLLNVDFNKENINYKIIVNQN